MSTITTKDGVEIFYKDWGKGQPIVFSHGWPLSADDWDTQMLFFLGKGFRVIAHDTRGHGRSTQTGGGHDMDHYADDLAALTAHLDLNDAVHVGHSTGGGEVVHYLARHGESRVAKATTWTLDQVGLDRPGNADIKLDLFLSYGTNVPLYSEFQAFFKQYQPPTLIVWGKNDFIFPPEGAAPYSRDLKDVETHLLDTGHFALETDGEEIARRIEEFLWKHQLAA